MAATNGPCYCFFIPLNEFPPSLFKTVQQTFVHILAILPVIMVSRRLEVHSVKVGPGPFHIYGGQTHGALMSG